MKGSAGWFIPDPGDAPSATWRIHFQGGFLSHVSGTFLAPHGSLLRVFHSLVVSGQLHTAAHFPEPASQETGSGCSQFLSPGPRNWHSTTSAIRAVTKPSWPHGAGTLTTPLNRRSIKEFTNIFNAPKSVSESSARYQGVALWNCGPVWNTSNF